MNALLVMIHNNVEYVIWVMALMFMSWPITNLKRKTQNGHCQNVNHSHGDTNPRLSRGNKISSRILQRMY